MTMMMKGAPEGEAVVAAPVPEVTEAGDFRTELAEKIFLDRYALKSSDKRDIAAGDVVVYCPNPHEDEKWRQREIGVVTAVHHERGEVSVRPRADAQATPIALSMDYVDKPLELTWNQMSRRVAAAIAQAETNEADRRRAEARFYEALSTRTFVPGGRILAGAGAPGDLTFYNCFVIPSPKDSRKGILETAAQQFEIMSRGGGVGINVSSLRPRYDSVIGVNGRSSGAVSWADLYSFITGKVEQGGSRRGALMIIMDIWHPDIENFIASKRKAGVLDNANISVGISDAFMKAVEDDGDWPLVFPDRSDPQYNQLWDGNLEAWKAAGRKVTTYRTVKARSLYDKICESAWASAEPGLFFVDRVNRFSNSHYYQPIRCTNPCGEQPLPPWGVCNLGALNLAEFVRPSPDDIAFWPTLGDEALDGKPNGGSAARARDEAIERAVERVDIEKLRRMTQTGIHFLDNVIDATTYFFAENENQQKTERRVGLGVMGLAELLVKIGVPYGSRLALAVVDKVFETIRDSAIDESVELARIKGPFPRFIADKFLESEFTAVLPDRARERIRNHGIRNVTLLTVAPTGTTGTMMATSTGIEPFFMFQFERRGRLGSHLVNEAVVTDYCRDMGLPQTVTELPGQFRTTEDLSPLDHVEVMAVAQKYVDSAISKTCNLPHDFSVEDVKTFYRKLYELGCKGGTVYRDRSREEQVLVKLPEAETTAVATTQGQVPAKPAVIEPVKRLPSVPRQGFTHSVQTPIGRVHVTLNTDPGNGSPFDVFVTLSKAGSDTDADTDALGRLISLLLRLNVEIPSRTRLELAIEQIRGIATSRSVGFGPDRVRSVPDGIGRCLEKLIEHIDQSRLAQAAIPSAAMPAAIVAETVEAAVRGPASPPSGGAFMQVCPDCGNATAANVDGCFKCFSCGYSEC